MPSPVSTPSSTSSAGLPGARPALLLLIAINLFNYIDRQVLAAVVPQIKQTYFGANGSGPGSTLGALLEWCQHHLGFKPENALVGLLSMASAQVSSSEPIDPRGPVSDWVGKTLVNAEGVQSSQL